MPLSWYPSVHCYGHAQTMSYPEDWKHQPTVARSWQIPEDGRDMGHYAISSVSPA